jgi:hypothetical protein
MTSDLNIDFLYFSLIIIIYAQAVNKYFLQSAVFKTLGQNNFGASRDNCADRRSFQRSMGQKHVWRKLHTIPKLFDHAKAFLHQ